MKRSVEFFEEEHVYLVDGVAKPSVTTIISPITSAHYGAIKPVAVETARIRGSFVHEATQLIDYGFQPEIPYEVAGYVKAYLSFLRDYSPEWHGIEEIVYDDIADVCGTVDRYGIIDGKYAVVDIKAQNSPSVENRISVCAQTAEYARALKKPDAKRYGLFLKSDGKYVRFDCIKYEEKRNFNGFSLFDRLLGTHNEIERIKNGK